METMRLPFSLFLAMKYLKPKRSFISVVTLFSVLGVLLGVAVLIIVLAVMSGFDEMWREKILSFNPHITVSTYSGIVEDPEDALGKIRSVPGVKGAAPFVQGLVFLQFRDRVYTPVVRGVDPQQERTISRIPESMVAGTFSVDEHQAVVGADLAAHLGLHAGDRVLVYSPQQFVNPDELHLPEEMTIAGIYEVGMWEFDMGYLVTSLSTARDLYRMDEGVHGLQVMVNDPYRPHIVAQALREALGGDYVVQTWIDQNHQLFAALRVEKNMMFFLLIFITVVAAFGITNTLITTAVQKTREIGLLKALGFTSAAVARVFFWQSFIQGVLGTSLGIAAGLWVLRYRNDLLRFLSREFRLELFPKELYHLSEIPAVVYSSDLVLIAAAALIICTLAGMVPAMRAAGLDPVAALRYE
jgi:lipoprotein-releasing system permease protein